MAEIGGYLNIIKDAGNGEDVRDAIINCMNEINKDSAFKVTNKTITEKLSDINKTYSAPAGQVWKQVTLNIQDDESGETINKGNQTSYDFEVNNYTAPGTYDAKTEHGENAVWGNIIVNVDHSGEWDGIVDNVTISTEDLDQTGTYSASTQGLTAFKSLTFSNVDPIKDGGGYYGGDGQGYFNITFDAAGGQWSDGSKQKKMSIKAGSMVDIDPKPTKAGFDFMGWLSNYGGNGLAKRSETVRANWGNSSILVGEIEDSWEVIANKGGAGYENGRYKSLRVDVEIPYSADLAVFPDIKSVYPDMPTEGTYRYYAEWLFMKVADAEGGAKSSWMTMLPAYMYNAPVPQHIWYNYDGDYSRIDPKYNKSDYGMSKSMIWLNTVFMDYVMPEVLKAHIVPIIKHYHATTEAGTDTYKTSSKRIWIPSVKELYIEGFDDDPLYSSAHPSEIDDIKDKLFNRSVDQAYLNANLQLTDGTQRRNLFELMTSNWIDGERNTTRDMGIGANTSDVVYCVTPHTYTIEEQNIDSSWIDGLVVSRGRMIRPHILGFNLA